MKSSYSHSYTESMNEHQLREYRCPCGKLLFKALITEGSVEIKCKGCRNIIQFQSGATSVQTLETVAV